MAKRPETFSTVLDEAMRDFKEHGFDSAERLEYWDRRLREAAVRGMIPEQRMEQMVREAMAAVYRREVENFGALKRSPGVKRYVIDTVKPRLRAELDRRIMANAQLIKLNRQREIEATMQRFAGWATSVPVGGTDQSGKEEAQKIRKSLSGLSFRERRVMVDQGHKLVSAIDNVVAVGGGAIAGVWRSHWKQANYDYREDHKERDQLLYVVRGNWAMERGLMKLGGRQYTDEITQPAEEPFCRCFYKWVYAISALPDDMITQKGREELARARAALAA